MPDPHMSVSPEPRAGAALYRLLAWLSPSFPVGAFSYSHSLEATVAAGTVHDRATLQSWIAAIVSRGSGRIDADILCEAYRAAEAGDRAALVAANERGCAFRATAELALEAGQQGVAFLNTCLAAWPDAFLEAWADPNPNPLPVRGERENAAAGKKPSPRETGRGRGPRRQAREGEGQLSISACGPTARTSCPRSPRRRACCRRRAR
jgi:urease accessory protein